ncbi:ferritin-like domain-containing protein [Phytohabitans sp. ZYX-F-186]|uniref:Ferritin-like domain-containing protein n=1 Tax=Phytohabitans maris TaxID=3071409 RepID=A0ABU0ZVB4_9ACTN|nr:ferritin-like domain-containing protein [Phytohabitans sp. ZYX-F-186]MDQ7909877.1 ferritin-like domain-containing protein [Phytohabitans sp. ZYX-F-186]
MTSRPELRRREVRDRALFDLDDGPVTPSNRAELPAVARLLNVLLASMVVSSLQYEQHALLVRAPSHRPVAELLHAWADRDRGSARLLAVRVRQLGFTAEYDPQHLAARSRVSFRSFGDGDLAGVVAQDLLGTRILVQTLQEAVRWVADDDPTTRRLLERLLEDKEDQAEELSAQCAVATTARPVDPLST